MIEISLYMQGSEALEQTTGFTPPVPEPTGVEEEATPLAEGEGGSIGRWVGVWAFGNTY